MTFSRVLPLFLLFAGCGDKDNTTDDSAGSVDPFGTFVYDTDPLSGAAKEAPTGDLSCWTVGTDWLTTSADPSCVTTQPFDGVVEDFEEGDAVPDAFLEIFNNDKFAEGQFDYDTQSDSNGQVSGDLQTCSPFTYRVYTDPVLEETVVTIQGHEIYGFRGDGTPHAPTFNSVSTKTFNIIPSLLGISVKDGFGIAAGTSFDCNEDPVEFAQILARDSSGKILPDVDVRYFVKDFPNRDQPWTSADGLWVVVNIPPGSVTLEMWAQVDGENQLIGTSVMDVVPDSINIANAYYGFDGGVVYPTSCQTACSADE